MGLHLELTTSASSEDARLLSDAIVAFNHRKVPDLEPISAEVRFFILVRDDAGTLVGGLRGACFWNTLHVELLWMSDALRGAGTGRAVIERAEAFAREQACQLALVQTTSWQARPFYEKCGYACFGTVDGLPRDHATHFLHKRL
jgi:GNAT superfamily N-acetyltransferase